MADWNEEINDWSIKNPLSFKDPKAGGAKRP
jgi:hypothetical protein